MSEHSEHRTYTGQATVVLIIALVALLYIFWGQNPSVVAIAKDTFDLTRSDILMIPVSGLGFFVFYILMKKFFFSRVLELIETRERLTQGAQSSAQELIKNTERLQKQAEQKIFDARLTGAQAKLAELAKAKTAAQSIIDASQSEAADKLKSFRAELSVSNQKQEKQLLGQLDEMANQAVGKILEVPKNMRTSLN